MASALGRSRLNLRGTADSNGGQRVGSHTLGSLKDPSWEAPFVAGLTAPAKKSAARGLS